MVDDIIICKECLVRADIARIHIFTVGVFVNLKLRKENTIIVTQ